LVEGLAVLFLVVMPEGLLAGLPVGLGLLIIIESFGVVNHGMKLLLEEATSLIQPILKIN